MHYWWGPSCWIITELQFRFFGNFHVYTIMQAVFLPFSNFELVVAQSGQVSTYLSSVQKFLELRVSSRHEKYFYYVSSVFASGFYRIKCKMIIHDFIVFTNKSHWLKMFISVKIFYVLKERTLYSLKYARFKYLISLLMIYSTQREAKQMKLISFWHSIKLIQKRFHSGL